MSKVDIDSHVYSLIKALSGSLYIEVTAWSPLGNGVPTGKYKKNNNKKITNQNQRLY